MDSKRRWNSYRKLPFNSARYLVLRTVTKVATDVRAHPPQPWHQPQHQDCEKPQLIIQLLEETKHHLVSTICLIGAHVHARPHKHGFIDCLNRLKYDLQIERVREKGE